MSGGTVINNTADDGGGMYLDIIGEPTVANTMIADNRASEAGGLYIGGSSPFLVHTTIARNSGSIGIYVTDHSNPVLTNTILVSHTIGIDVNNGNTATLKSTLWHGNDIDHRGNVTHINDRSGDPAFVDPVNGNYHIGSDSAALDEGVDAGITIDIDSQLRPAGAGYDIGADELFHLVYLPLVMRGD